MSRKTNNRPKRRKRQSNNLYESIRNRGYKVFGSERLKSLITDDYLLRSFLNNNSFRKQLLSESEGKKFHLVLIDNNYFDSQEKIDELRNYYLKEYENDDTTLKLLWELDENWLNKLLGGFDVEEHFGQHGLECHECNIYRFKTLGLTSSFTSRINNPWIPTQQIREYLGINVVYTGIPHGEKIPESEVKRLVEKYGEYLNVV